MRKRFISKPIAWTISAMIGVIFHIIFINITHVDAWVLLIYTLIIYSMGLIIGAWWIG